ncbi:MAG: NADH:ubiquinone reductase (Na(+)-transporting) subunit F [Bacteroidota bacterium]
MKLEIEALRDYSLVGVEAKKAIEMGLADAEWYRSPVPKHKMRELLVRKDGPAIRDTLLWFGLIIGSGYLFFVLWGTWWAILPYIVYSTLYASASDSRWHESSHGTAFKTDWMNIALYEISSFMVFRQSTVWRWSHFRHHSDTIIRGRDPEISMKRPPLVKRLVLGIMGLGGAIPEFRQILLHATGKIDKEVATYVPPREHASVILKARMYLSIYISVVFLALYFNTILPLMFIGFPTVAGGWLLRIYGWTQHAGLQENVLDHRLNSRTVYMNRIHRFLYWNMNYHVEHHMFPLVPYHALPKLHELIKDDCPAPKNGLIDAYKEIIPAIIKQMKDANYYINRELPSTASIIAPKKENFFVGDPSKRIDGKIKVCQLAELPIGDIIRFDFGQKTYAVYHSQKGELFATDGMCTHGNAHLSDGIIIGNTVECQKHNGRFNLKDGTPDRLPVCIGLKTYKVEVLDQEVYIHIPGETEVLSDKEGVSFQVLSNHNLTAYIKELVLAPTNGKSLSFRPGQYVQMEIPPHSIKTRDFNMKPPYNQIWANESLDDSWSRNTIYLKRNYSLASNPINKAILKFNIRIALSPEPRNLAMGKGSSYVFSLKPGDEVRLTGPYGNFVPTDTQREMIYLGGGAGMAPIRSHLSYLLETENTTRKVSFWYGARSKQDLYYQEYFSKLEQNLPNFSFHVALSDYVGLESWEGSTGFVHEVLYEKYLKRHPSPQAIEYYLCGPPAMIRASVKMLKELGVSDEMVVFDEF